MAAISNASPLSRLRARHYIKMRLYNASHRPLYFSPVCDGEAVNAQSGTDTNGF